MPIQKLKVTWEVDMELFARFCAREHKAMHIDAVQSAVKETEFEVVNDPEDMLKIGYAGRESITKKRRGGDKVVLVHMAATKKRMNTKEIRAILLRHNYSAKSVSNFIFEMKNEKYIKRVAYGLYAITAKGIAYVQG